MGLPFTSYIFERLVTPFDSMHSIDSHWFLPTESPAKTMRPLRLLSRRSLELNLSVTQGINEEKLLLDIDHYLRVRH